MSKNIKCVPKIICMIMMTYKGTAQHGLTPIQTIHVPNDMAGGLYPMLLEGANLVCLV